MMKFQPVLPPDFYYTDDHEWIYFKGVMAFAGVGNFKFTGFKEIQLVMAGQMRGFRRQGDRLASMRYKDYEIHFHMPVDGNIVTVNTALLNGKEGALLTAVDGECWIVQLFPAHPFQRAGLVTPPEYRRKFSLAGNRNTTHI